MCNRCRCHTVWSGVHRRPARSRRSGLRLQQLHGAAAEHAAGTAEEPGHAEAAHGQSVGAADHGRPQQHATAHLVQPADAGAH